MAQYAGGIGQTEAAKVTGETIQTMGESQRFWRLNWLEEYYGDTVYDGRDVDYNGTKKPAGGWKNWSPETSLPYGAAGVQDQVDLRNARPHCRYALAGVIVHEFTSKLFGEGRFPKIVVAGDPEAEDFANEAAKQCRMPENFIEARDNGGAVGTSVLIVKAREGKYRIEVMDAKLIKAEEVVWADRDEWVPKVIVIEYKYFADVPNPETGRPDHIQFWFRRMITDKEDVTYKPVKVGMGEKPVFTADPTRTFVHGLGLCPVVWVQNTRNTKDLDGTCDFDLSIGTIDEINHLLSQSSRGIHMNMDPHTFVFTTRKGGTIKRGSGQVTMLNPEDKAEQMGLPPEPFAVTETRIDRLRAQALEQSQCVILDSEKISGAAQSAEAMRFLYEKMLARCNVLRAQYGQAIVRCVEIMLTIARVQPTMVKLPPKFEPDPEKPAEPGTPKPRTPGKPEPTVQVQWGPYFRPTVLDVKTATETAGLGMSTGALDETVVAKFLADYFQIPNVGEMVQRMQDAKAEKEQQRMEKLDAMAAGRPGAGGPGGGAPPRKGAAGPGTEE